MAGVELRRLALAWVGVTAGLLVLFAVFEPVLGGAGTAPRRLPALTLGAGLGRGQRRRLDWFLGLTGGAWTSSSSGTAPSPWR